MDGKSQDRLLHIMKTVDEAQFLSRSHDPLEQILRLLDKRPAHAREVDAEGNGVFHHAVRSGVLDNKDVATVTAVLQRFQEAGANVDLQNMKGQSALHLLCFGSDGYSKPFDEQLFKALVQAGADLDLRDVLGQTPLFTLVQSRSLQVKPLGKSRGPLRREPRLICATLLQVGAHIDVSDLKGRSLLHAAISNQACDCAFVQFLVDKGLDPQSVDNEGNTLWHAAINRLTRSETSDGIQLASSLLELQVDIHKANNVGRTPLHEASSVFWERTAKLPDLNADLFDYGNTQKDVFQQNPATTFDYILGTYAGDVDPRDANGITPLHLACTFSEYQTRRLLESRANSLLKTNEGLTSLHLAARSRQANIIGIILEHLSTQKDEEAIQEFVNAADTTGRTALYYACASGRIETVQLLLEAGATAYGGTFASSLWCAVVEFPDEEEKWKASNLHWVLPNRERAGAVLINDIFRPKAFRTARLNDVVDMIVNLDGRKNFVSEAIDIAVKKQSGYTVERLWHAMTSLQDGVTVPVSQAVSACLAERRAVQADLQNSNPTPKSISEAVQRLMRLRQYDLVEDVLLEQGWGELDRSGNTVYHELVSGGLVWILRRLKEPVRELAAHLEDAKWCDQERFNSSRTRCIRPEKIRPLLLTACQSEAPNFDMVKFLVAEAGCDVNAQGYLSLIQYGKSATWAHESPVHSLVRGSHWWQIAQALPYLVEHGADLDLQNAKGQTPLNAVLERIGYVDFSQQVIDALLYYGADVKLVDLAKTSNHLDLTQFFLRRGAVVTPEAIYAAIKVGNCEVLTALLDGGGDPNVIPKILDFPKSSSGPVTTPVALPVEPPEVPRRADRPVRKLASIGRDPRKLFAADMYPVDHAAHLFSLTRDNEVEERRKFEEVIMILLAHGADPTRTYLDGAMSIVDRIIEQEHRADRVLALFGQGGQDHMPGTR